CRTAAIRVRTYAALRRTKRTLGQSAFGTGSRSAGRAEQSEVTPGTNVANIDRSRERDVIPTIGCRVRREDEALDDHIRRVPRAHDTAIEQPYDDQDMVSEPRTIALVSCVSSKNPHAAP